LKLVLGENGLFEVNKVIAYV